MVRRPTVIALLTLVSLMVLVVSGISPALSKGKDVEIFSWWTAGGEANALNALIQEYEKAQPGMKIVNTAVAGGAGSVAKAVLVSRMMGNDPPDSFQVHAGRELIDTWVITKKMESLNDLFASEGWQQVMPKGILDIVSYKGKYWSVPVNIHRSNNIWYNKDVFQKFNLKPPTTFDEFFKVAEFLQSKGVIPCVMGSANGWEMGHVFEDVLAGVLGAEAYIGLWDGKTQWTDPRVAKALELFKKMLNYVNKDHAALTWDAAAEYLVSGKGAMLIQGDWADGWFKAKGATNIGRAPTPGTTGIFVALSDTFAIPKGAKNREGAIAWLKLVGSKRGQEAFNALKGSIPARVDCDLSTFNEYQKSAVDDWKHDKIVPSVVHGAAASESWATTYKDIIAIFAKQLNVAAAQKALQGAADEALEF